MKYKKYSYLFLLLSLLAGGAYLRVGSIGDHSFWTDEFFAVYAAKSYNSNGSFYVPYEGEHPYRKLVTYITSFMFRTFGESETTARIPFAIANILFSILAYFIFAKIFNKRIALIVFFVITFSPIFIKISSECRSYTLHQLFYFVAAVLFFCGFEYNGDKSPYKIPYLLKRIETHNQINIIVLLVALIFGYIAITLQPLTYNFVFVIAAYSITMLCLKLFIPDFFNKPVKKYYIVFVFLFLGAAWQYLFNHEYFVKMLNWAASLPDWARHHKYSVHTYRWFFEDQYPGIFYLYPLGVYLLVKQFKEKGIFFVYMFLVPILLHSFVYKLKADRYIFYIFPYSILGLAIFIDSIYIYVKEDIKTLYNNKKYFVYIIILPVILFYSQPWLIKSFKEAGSNNFPDWFSFSETFKSKIKDSVVIVTRPREYLYYFGKNPDYSVVNELPKRYKFGDDLIDSENKLKKVISENKDIYLIAYRRHMKYKSFFSYSMEKYIRENMYEVNENYEKSFIVLKRKI